MTVYWREIITPANPRHCRYTSEVKAWHFSPAMSPLSPAPGEPGIQMTGALLLIHSSLRNERGHTMYIENYFSICDGVFFSGWPSSAANRVCRCQNIRCRLNDPGIVCVNSICVPIQPTITL